MWKTTLKDWGLDNYIQVFEDEGIDDQSFNLIEESTIETLFKKSGPKLIFKNFFMEYIKQNKISLENVSENVSVVSSGCSTMDSELESITFIPDEELVEAFNLDNFCPDPSIIKRIKVDSVFPEGLEAVLKKTTDGQMVLLNKNKLNNDYRQKLCKVVLNELISIYGPELKSSTFIKVSKEIEDFFINETAVSYYIPYVSKESGPKGKLWYRYVNVRTSLRQANLFRKKHSSDSQTAERVDEVVSDETEKQLDFLKVATEPYAKILEAWDNTYKMRKRIYMNSGLSQLYQDFPCLGLNSGIEVIETDFNKKYENKIDIIYSTFKKVSEAIKKELDQRKINVVPVCHDDSLLALISLPYLFPPVTLKKSRKGLHWRPTRSEVGDSFFLHVENYYELDERVKERQKKLADHNLTLQPFAAAVGNLANEITEFYIVADAVKYKIDSTVRTFELLFKFFHALDIEYAFESEHVWLFVEEVFFQLKPKKKNPSTASVIADIKFHLDGKFLSEESVVGQ